MKIDLKIQGFIHGNRILKKISKIIRWIEKKEPKLRVTFEAERYTYPLPTPPMKTQKELREET